MKVSCEVIQDLLPLYVDKLTSEKSTLMVENHLKECKECNRMYSKMVEEIPDHTESVPSENIERKLVKRIRNKKIVSASSLIVIFSVLGFFLGGFVFYSNNATIKSVTPIPVTAELRNVNENPAEKIQLQSSIWKSYQVDNKDFKPGYYDITAIEGNVEIDNIQLSEGEKLLGKKYFSNNNISVRGNGIVQLTPARFKEEKLVDKTYTFSNKSVFYQGGKEIKPGTYNIQVLNSSKKP
ncbi:hypothetical protein DXT76_16790, partial [Halobacillus trueperi]